MKIKTNGLKSYSNVEISLNFSGTLSTNENVSFNADYDKEGKLVTCSAPYSSTGCPDYYIEIAEYFKTIKDMQGEQVLNLIEKIKAVVEPIRKQQNETSIELIKKETEITKLYDEKKEISKKLNRFKKQEKIDEYTSKLNVLDSQIKTLDEEIDKLNEKEDQLYVEYRKAEQIEVM